MMPRDGEVSTDELAQLPPLIPPDRVHALSREMLQRCPVAHSDQDGGFWLVNRHADLVRVMQDWEGFASGNRGVRVPKRPIAEPPMPPIDSNPPLHRDVRRIMNPFLSPGRLAEHEEHYRQIIGGLIDGFAPDGHGDIAWQLAKKFPSHITSWELFGVTDPEELDRLRHWVRRLSYDMTREDPKVLAALHAEWVAWIQDLIDRRRTDPGDDIISALITTPVEDGRHLDNEELIGAVEILSKGGFSTTADATCNIVIRLIEEPGLEATLRDHPEKIPAAIEEVMRLDPPVTARPRRATADVEIGGKVIRKDERVLCNYLAANVDPEEWEEAEEFRLDRVRNRVMTFGAGPHRCIGSNLARLSLRIVVEELLARVKDIRWAGDEREERISFNPSAWRAVDSLKVTFTPLVGVSASA